jgi:hypothetical protein
LYRFSIADKIAYDKDFADINIQDYQPTVAITESNLVFSLESK